MFQMTPEATFYSLLSQNKPQATATILGNAEHPGLQGYARFFETPYAGLLIEVEIYGLPDQEPENKHTTSNIPHFFGMHIHEKGDCTPPFDRTGNHYNPKDFPHPQHLGDLPPLMSSNGYAFTIFYDALLSIKDVENRSLIIHAQPDDFTTQPSGNSGNKIGCGVIQRLSHGAQTFSHGSPSPLPPQSKKNR